MSLLGERLIGVDTALREAAIPHAFGGAIALAYCTEEPRGTRDLDVNIFMEPGRADEVFDARTVDCARVLARLRSLLGASDPAVVRLAALCR